MIKIRIETNGTLVADEFTRKKTNMTEVSIALLKLKQIEQKLIAMEFQTDVEMLNEDEDA